ncbi:protein-tyrosine-phosphatase [Burkholderia gladioli]|uniref:arsenate reductase/protein-tyrosine-phosphatase family protein n=1 Tax=Burkholderia gladioli TaxID=28095 RepID=UPI00163DEBA7|nr:protein-tyrosine-phosphatase [Burkholderia gladioli]
METLLVICTANLCRSPMAAALFERALPGWRVWSAGVEAMPGLPPDPLAVECLRRLGLEIGTHRSQSLAQWMLEAASLVLTMSERQRRVIARRYPSATGRVWRLLDEDLADPYRRGPAAYPVALDRLQAGVERWSRRIARAAQPPLISQDAVHEPV